MATFMKSYLQPAITYFKHTPCKDYNEGGGKEKGKNTLENSVLVAFIKVQCSI